MININSTTAIYNYNVINLSKENGLKIDFGFDLPSKFDFIK